MSKNTEYWGRLNRRNARNERAWQQKLDRLDRRGRARSRVYRRNLDEQALQMRLKTLNQPTPRRPHNTQLDGVHPVLVAISIVIAFTTMAVTFWLMR